MCQWFFGAILGSLAIPKLFRKFNAILGSFPYLHDRKPIIESDCELLCGLSPVCNGHRLFATDLCIGRRVFRGPYPKGKCLLFLVTLRSWRLKPSMAWWYKSTWAPPNRCSDWPSCPARTERFSWISVMTSCKVLIAACTENGAKQHGCKADNQDNQ